MRANPFAGEFKSLLYPDFFNMAVLIQIGLWLLRKLSVALAVAAVILLAGGAYLYLTENIRSDTKRRELIEQLHAEGELLEQKAAELDAKIDTLREAMDEQRQRAEIARRLLSTYEQMNTIWDWLLGAQIDPETLEKNKQSAERHRDTSLERVEAIVGQSTDVTRERAATLNRLSEIDLEVVELEQSASPVIDYIRQAWENYRWVLIAALAAYFFGPTIAKVLAYYVLAPLIGAARPIRLEPEHVAAPGVAPSGVSESISLETGESVFVRERFLQASDESLQRRTRFVLDWHIPVK